jgi:hypothetical protein
MVSSPLPRRGCRRPGPWRHARRSVGGVPTTGMPDASTPAARCAHDGSGCRRGRCGFAPSNGGEKKEPRRSGVCHLAGVGLLRGLPPFLPLARAAAALAGLLIRPRAEAAAWLFFMVLLFLGISPSRRARRHSPAQLYLTHPGTLHTCPSRRTQPGCPVAGATTS